MQPVRKQQTRKLVFPSWSETFGGKARNCVGVLAWISVFNLELIYLREIATWSFRDFTLANCRPALYSERTYDRQLVKAHRF